jgi:hypothetical protein
MEATQQRGNVMTDHESPLWSVSDRKPHKLATCVLPFHRDIRHHGARWSALAPHEELLQVGLFTFSDDLHTAIAAIPHPAMQAKPASVVASRSAEKYPLYPATDIHMHSFHFVVVS